MNYLRAYFRKFFAFLIILTFIALVTQFSNIVDVPIETGFSILFRALGVFVVCLIIWVLQFLPFSMLFPILLGGFAWAFFPALDYWSSKHMTKTLLGFELSDPGWYMQWYAKTVFVLIPIIIGIAICSSWKKQNKARRGPVEW